MKKRKVTDIVSIIVIILIVIIGVWIWHASHNFSLPAEEKIKRNFNSDYEELDIVAQYLAKSKYGLLDIDPITAPNKISYGGSKEIEEAEVLEAIKKLKKHGYSYIGKKGNTIYFIWHTRFNDYSSGIAYSINGEDEPMLDHLTKLEPLSENGWYFYEEDYNKWRLSR